MKDLYRPNYINNLPRRRPLFFWVFASILALALIVHSSLSLAGRFEDEQKRKELTELFSKGKKTTLLDELYKHKPMPDKEWEDLQRKIIGWEQEIEPTKPWERMCSEEFVGKDIWGNEVKTRETLRYDEVKGQPGVRVISGRLDDLPVKGLGRDGVLRRGELRRSFGFRNYQKFDHRTQKWYYAEKTKDNFGNDIYEIDKWLMMEVIRRDTIKRQGPEGYKKLMDHARKQSVEYKVEQAMKEIKAKEKAERKRKSTGFKATGSVGKTKEKQQAKLDSKPDKQATDGRRVTAKKREKEMEHKAQAQQERDMKGEIKKENDPGAGIPVIPETCVIDIVFWDPKKPGDKMHGFLCIRGGKYRMELEQKCAGFTKDGTYWHPSEFRSSWDGQLSDNVITSTQMNWNSKPGRHDFTTGNGEIQCSNYSSLESKGSFTMTFQLGGRLKMSSNSSGVHRFWCNNPRCCKENEYSFSNSQKWNGTWSIRKKNTGTTDKTGKFGRCTFRTYCP